MSAGSEVYDLVTRASVKDISEFLDDVWAQICNKRGNGDGYGEDDGDGDSEDGGEGGEGGEGGSEASSLANRLAGLEA